ncbi:MAG: amidohydrolase family protein, partial [Candidatus Rokuibacteriota bacterium]
MSGAAMEAFVGDRIITMDDRTPRAEVVVVQQGRIAAVGPRALLQRFPGAAVQELGTRTLLPGFVDAHNHLCFAALHPRWADLTATADLDALARALRSQAVREPEASWIRGFGWDESLTGPLTRRDLDALGLDRPIVVAHYSFHQCVVDSRGLEELEIGRTTSDPEGGRIERGPHGEPTGLLVERAWSEAHVRSLRDYSEPDRWGELIAARGRALLRDGITCVHDAACPPAAEAVYRALAARHELPLSVLVMPHAE